MFCCTYYPSTIKPNFKSFDQYLTEPCKESFLISPCTKNEILDYNKAVGINSIPIKILKLAKEQIAKHLCFIYNLPFTIGIFPDSLEIAKVTPVYKKSSKLECANYRPITLLSNLDKIIEKLMHKKLMGFLNEQKVLYKKQFRFQKNCSTAHAIISVIENIEKAIDNEMFVCEVFVDLQKAFDTVDHNILLHKLSHYGIKDIANCLFSSYLSNRKQFVTINGYDPVIQSF